MSELGQKRRSERPPVTSGVPWIVLQKSFCLTDHKFSGLWARRSNIDVGDRFIL
jgi:hypothetical protein